MPDVRTTPFNRVCAVLGTFLFCMGFVSYLVKERLYISEALISLVAGVVVSPHVTNIVNPQTWGFGQSSGDPAHNVEAITHDFSRLILSIQVAFAGSQLPGRYARIQWRSLAIMLGPVMLGMWLMSGLFIWAIVSYRETEEALVRMPFLHALVIASCIAPTDPVLSNTIVKGRWADRHVPVPIAQLISAESGANDGLGYPFLYFALYLIKYMGTSGYAGHPGDGEAAGRWGGARSAMGIWFGETWGYVILLSVVWGAAVGWVSRWGLKVAKSLGYVDRENLFALPLIMAVFLLGTCGMVGSDDILACFVAGNVLSWDNWYRHENKHDSFQPTIDMLLNVMFFVWFGVVCPWPLFASSIVALWRLVVLGIVILLLRRPPLLLLVERWLRQVNGQREALFVGFFGPIGVSAIFYQHVALEFLRSEITGPDGHIREDVKSLHELVTVVVWFIVLCSIIVHGLAIPLYQAGLYIIQHGAPHRFDSEEMHSIRETLSKEIEYIQSRPWVHRLEDGIIRTLEPGRTPPFRRVRIEEGGKHG